MILSNIERKERILFMCVISIGMKYVINYFLEENKYEGTRSNNLRNKSN